MYHTFSQFDPPNNDIPQQRRAPSQAGTQAASPSPQPAPFAHSAIHSPISSSGLCSPMAQGQRNSPAWDIERQLAAQGHGQVNNAQPRLPNDDSQWAGVFTAAPPSTRPRPRMRPVPPPEEDDLPTVGALMQLLREQPLPALTRASAVVHPSHSQGKRLSQPIHLAPSPSDSSSQPIEFAPSQDNYLAQGPLFAQYPLGPPGSTQYPLVQTRQGDWVPNLGSLPTSPGLAIDLMTPSASVGPQESNPSVPPSPNAQQQRRAAKGKAVDPKEKASKSKSAPRKRKANANKAAGSSTKRARTSKDAGMTASDISDTERADLDVPMDNFEEDEQEEGEDHGEGTVGQSQRIPEFLQKMILQWYTKPEHWDEVKNDSNKAIKQLVGLTAKYEVKAKTILDFLGREHRNYALYHRMAMKTGGGKDNLVTEEDMKDRYKRLGMEKTFDYWMKYGESWKFELFHAVSWESDDVCKFSHFDSVTSTASDDEGTSKRSSSKGKGKKKSRATDSGSDTERGSPIARTKRGNFQVIGVIVEGMESLAVTRSRQADVSEKLYQLEVQKSKNDEAAQKERLTLDQRSQGIDNYLKLVGNLNHQDELVSLVARRFLIQLSNEIAPLPEQPAPIAPAPALPVSALAPVPIPSAPVPSANTTPTTSLAATPTAEVTSTSEVQELSATADSSTKPIASGSGCSLPSLV
ncbi:hypothetical protein FRC07_002628 [Ceratobasidium sp. 392]|nr:hypothetical protein FRC07_002628 [Ceratobasidium sp. 392]